MSIIHHLGRKHGTVNRGLVHDDRKYISENYLPDTTSSLVRTVLLGPTLDPVPGRRSRGEVGEMTVNRDSVAIRMLPKVGPVNGSRVGTG